MSAHGISSNGAAVPAAQPSAAEAGEPAGGLVQGRVFALDGPLAVGVSVGEESVWARRALSCLIAPEVGDRVLVARSDGEAFVLAVLDRLLPDAMTLSVPEARSVVLCAPDLALQAEGPLALRAREARLEGENVHILAKSFQLVGRVTTLIADLLRATARRSETTAEEVVVQATDRTTRVRGTDVSEVGTAVRNVEQVSVETAQSAVLTAKDDLRFDGARVTVG